MPITMSSTGASPSVTEGDGCCGVSSFLMMGRTIAYLFV